MLQEVVLEISFVLFIIMIMTVIYWFISWSDVGIGTHKKAYASGVLFYIFALIARIISVYADYHFTIQRCSPLFVGISHAFYLSFLMIGYALFGYLNMCFINFNVRMPKWMRYLYFIPDVITVILIFASIFVNLVFHISPVSGYVHGPLHWVIGVIPFIYCLPGMLQLLQVRKYLPQNLIYCTLGTIIGFVVGMTVYALTNSKPVLFCVIAIVLLIQLFSVLFYDSFWDEKCKAMNQRAFEFYFEKSKEINKTLDMILIQMVGFHYNDKMKDEDNFQDVFQKISDDLKRMIKINTIYYLGNGSLCVAIREDDKKIRKDIFIKNLKSYFRDLDGEELKNISPVVDITYLCLPENVSQLDAIYSYIDKERTATDKRTEKVRFISKEEVQLVDSFREDLVARAVLRAIKNKSFKVFYQPIYSVNENRFQSAEALVRLNSPELGFISPDEFIPIAEKRGMMMDVGRLVFESVCSFLKTEDIHKYGLDYIEVNLSIGQFLDEGLERELSGCLEKYGLSKDLVNFEITETATPFIENRMRTLLKKMAEKGFYFSLDDFGVGYSDMDVITEYPLELVKIDKSIIWSALKEEKNFSTLKDQISMFHKLGYKVVAEGVETKEMVDRLTEMGFDYFQGFYYSKPIPVASFLSFLSKSTVENNHKK